MSEQAAAGSIRNVVFFPPGVSHAIYNSRLTDLTFIVVTAPLDDAEPDSA